MVQAIQTTYIGQTTHRPSRVKATLMYSRKSVTVSWGDEQTLELNHLKAVRALLNKVGYKPRVPAKENEQGSKLACFEGSEGSLIWVVISDLTDYHAIEVRA